jgi:DNA-binding GntR family transcriptional regulator
VPAHDAVLAAVRAGDGEAAAAAIPALLAQAAADLDTVRKGRPSLGLDAHLADGPSEV